MAYASISSYFIAILAVSLCSGAWYTLRVSQRIVVKCLDPLPGPERWSWITGNLLQLSSPDGLELHHNLVRRYGGAFKVHGMLGDEQIYVSDPLALRQITHNNEATFTETPLFVALNQLIFGESLTAFHGLEHRIKRRILNPAFSTANVRSLTNVMLGTAKILTRTMRGLIVPGELTEVDILNLLWRTSIDVIGESSLEYPFQCLKLDEPNLYAESVKNLFPTIQKLTHVLPLVPYIMQFGSSNFRRQIIDLVPWRTVQDLKHLIDIVQSKGEVVLRNSMNPAHDSKSIIALISQANLHGHGMNIPEKEIIGHINLLVFASSETTSSAMARILDLLTQHSSVQSDLRNELMFKTLDETMASGSSETSILDAVIKETLRLYPPVVKVDRIARDDIIIPLLKPVLDANGKLLTHFTVRKNQQLILGISSVNTDPGIWGPDALIWNPDRWRTALPETLEGAKIPGIFSNMMTFLGGERSCIGYRFAITEMKIILRELLLEFEFSRSEKGALWKLGNTQFPSIAGENDPKLPLLVREWIPNGRRGD